MKITSLNLRPQKKKSGESLMRRPVNIRDNCQPKIERLQNSFTLKTHLVVDRAKSRVSKTQAKINSRPRRFPTSYDSFNPVDQKQFENSLPVGRANQSLYQPSLAKQDGDCCSRRVSFCLKFRNGQQKKSASKTKRPNASWSQNRNIVNSYLINDALASDMFRLKRRRKLGSRNNNSQPTFVSEFKDQSALRRAGQKGGLSYFERDSIISYKHDYNSALLEKFAESSYEQQMEKKVLESQRSVLLNSIKGQMARTRKTMSNSKLDDLLKAAKLGEVQKMVKERKAHWVTSLVQRKYNPYCCYLTMTKHQKASFKAHHQQYSKNLNNNDLFDDIEVRLNRT